MVSSLGNRHSVLVTSAIDEKHRAIINEKLSGFADVIYAEDYTKEDNLNAWKNKIDIILAGKNGLMLTYDDIAELNRLKFIQLLSAGADHLEFDKIDDRISIASNSGSYSKSIAEHVLAITFASFKNIVIGHNALKNGVFNNRLVSRDMSGLTVGVVGFGGIGKKVSSLFKRCLDADILAINTTGITDHDVDFIGTINDLDVILGRSDIVVLSLPLTRFNRGLIGNKELKMMKSNALLVNVARGDLIIQNDLYVHLEDNHNFHAAIDAWWDEPLTEIKLRASEKFFSLDNFIGSPHNSYRSESSILESRANAAENIVRFITGDKPEGIIIRSNYC